MQDIVISLDLGANGSFELRSAADISAWVDEELRCWAFASKYSQGVFARYKQALAALKTYATGTAQPPDGLAPILDRVRSVYAGLPHHSSPMGKFVLDLKSQDDELATAALSFFSGIAPNNAATPNAIRGTILAAIYKLDPRAASQTAAESFESLRTRMIEWWTSQQHSINTALLEAQQTRVSISDLQVTLAADASRSINGFNQVLAELQVRSETAIREAREVTTDARSRLESLLRELTGDASARMLEIAKTFEEKLALQESVSYWTVKRDAHFRRAVTFAVAFFASLIGLVYCSFLFLHSGDGPGALLPNELDLAKLPLGRIALVGIIITSMLWVVRSFARLMFSNIHLHTDASERVVMVTTYLALLKESAALKDEDRKLVIETLFRRAATGIVKDDANPPFVWSNFRASPSER